MKRAIFVFLTFFWIFLPDCHSQNPFPITNREILGEWQSTTEEVSSTYLDTYFFYSNNRFAFRPTAYNGLNRIVEITGTYRIDNLIITFLPDSITECVGGTIERSHFTTLSDSWSIENCETKKSKIHSSPQETSIEKIYIAGKQEFYILIGKHPFYKLNNQPE